MIGREHWVKNKQTREAMIINAFPCLTRRLWYAMCARKWEYMFDIPCWWMRTYFRRWGFLRVLPPSNIFHSRFPLRWHIRYRRWRWWSWMPIFTTTGVHLSHGALASTRSIISHWCIFKFQQNSLCVFIFEIGSLAASLYWYFCLSLYRRALIYYKYSLRRSTPPQLPLAPS